MPRLRRLKRGEAVGVYSRASTDKYNSRIRVYGIYKGPDPDQRQNYKIGYHNRWVLVRVGTKVERVAHNSCVPVIWTWHGPLVRKERL